MPLPGPLPCEGTPGVRCPGPQGIMTYCSRGDLQLCERCEGIRFPDLNGRRSQQRTKSLKQRQLQRSVNRPHMPALTPTAPPLEEYAAELLQETHTDTASSTHHHEIQDDIIISDLLCFVANKIKIMPYDMLMKLCVDFYDAETIQTAKDTLYRTAFKPSEAPRNVKHRGDNKNASSMQDILNIFLEMSPSSVPCYVCKDLAKLPPLSMDNFDVSSVIKAIETLKLEMQLMKESQTTTIQSHVVLTRKVNKLIQDESSPDVQPNTADNPIVVTSDVNQDNATNLQHSSVFSDDEYHSGSGDDIIEEADDSELIQLARIQGRIPKSTSQQQRRPRYSDVARTRPQGGSSTSNDNNKKYNRKFEDRQRPNTRDNTQRAHVIVRGNGNNFQLHASRSGKHEQEPTTRQPTGIFVSRLAKTTSTQQIESHIHMETGLKIKCESLTTRHDSYRSFYVRISQREQAQLLKPAVWPKGVIVRPYMD